VAVLAGGVDNESIYPKNNLKLAHEIIKTGGAVISEFAPGTPIQGRYSFVYRNRIIAGMSLATIVTEGAADSGSLITAKASLEYNRQVFACPHQMFAHLGEGPNQLIKIGAEPILKPEDIFDALNLYLCIQQTLPTLPQLAKTEQKILEYCKTEDKTVDELSELLKLSASEMNVFITNLELKGLVKQNNGLIHIIHNF
jgi:DNA processing protein